MKKKTKKTKKTKAIVRINQTYAIDKPSQMIQAAKQIKEYIIKNNLSVQITGKDYVMVEGWQFAGSLMYLFPRIVKVEQIKPNEWLAQAEIVNRKTNEVVGTGFALCSKAEMKKASFDEYAILSMAQTRAIGKAFRNVIGWVIRLAGYEATPGEEIKGKHTDSKVKEVESAGGLMAGNQEKEKIKILAKSLGLNTIEKIEKATGLKVSFEGMTKNQSSRVYAELLQLGLSRK